MSRIVSLDRVRQKRDRQVERVYRQVRRRKMEEMAGFLRVSYDHARRAYGPQWDQEHGEQVRQLIRQSL